MTKEILKLDTYFDIENFTFENIQRIIRNLLTLGGDHSITYPVIKAFSIGYMERVDLIHIDAHADLYNIFEGDKYSHACPFARIMEEKLINRLIQIGIRTLSKRISANNQKNMALKPLEMSQIGQSNHL